MFAKLRAFICSVWLKADVQPVYAKLGGRSWLLIVFFAISAFILEWHGKLTADFAAVITALSGVHAGRAIMQDYHERHSQDDKS